MKVIALIFTIFVYAQGFAKPLTIISLNTDSTELVFQEYDYKKFSWKSSGEKEFLRVTLLSGVKVDISANSLWGIVYDRGSNQKLDTFIVIKNTSPYSVLYKLIGGDLTSHAVFRRITHYYFPPFFAHDDYNYRIMESYISIPKLPKLKKNIPDRLTNKCAINGIMESKFIIDDLVKKDKETGEPRILNYYQGCDSL